MHLIFEKSADNLFKGGFCLLQLKFKEPDFPFNCLNVLNICFRSSQICLVQLKDIDGDCSSPWHLLNLSTNCFMLATSLQKAKNLILTFFRPNSPAGTIAV